MSQAPKILILSPVPSHPSDQGNAARIMALATELRTRGMVLDFFYYGMEGLKDPQRAELTKFWDGFHFMPSLPLAEQKYPNAWGIDDWCPAQLCEKVKALHQRKQYDVVIASYVWMSRILEGLENTLKVVDTHDLFGDRHLVSTKAGLEPRWYFTTLAEEEIAFDRADLIWGIQDHETAQIASRTEVPSMTLGHIMPPYFLTGEDNERSVAMFGYLGSGNPWNEQSIRALDAALGADSSVDWLLAGSLLKRQLDLVSNPKRIGRVEKLEDFYHGVECVVNPMQGGTGLKIKTVEALAFGKPVIGTIDAFLGLPARHAAHRLNNAAECADMMRQYAANETLRNELLLASRTAYFDYSMSVSNQYNEFTQQIAALRAKRA